MPVLEKGIVYESRQRETHEEAGNLHGRVDMMRAGAIREQGGT